MLSKLTQSGMQVHSLFSVFSTELFATGKS